MNRHINTPLTKAPLIKPCPFCGYEVITRVSTNGIRYFDCPNCGVAIYFNFNTVNESLILWENREKE